MTSWFNGFDQISVATDDIEGAVAFWETQMGIGPWRMFCGLTLAMRYEARSIQLPCDIALAWHDGRLVELVAVKGAGPSPFHDALDRPIIGLQRLASLSEDIEGDAAAAEARGLVRFAEGAVAGQRFVYFRTSQAPGMIFELLERTSQFDVLVEGLKASAANYASAPPSDVSAVGETVGEMMAAELQGYGGAFSMNRVPLPRPGPGEVRIRIAGAAVNPVDLKARKGYLHDYVPLSFPARLGGDVSGVVEALGPGVTQFAIGDRVAGMINPFANGAYAECVVAAEAALACVPDAIDLADAAAVPTGVLTGIQLIERGVRPSAGDCILVTGAAGSTGRAAVMAALDAGAVVYAGVRPESRSAVADLPVAGTIDLSDEAALAGAGPFDAVADTVGGTIAENLFRHVRADGVIASIAMPPPEPPAFATQRFCSLTVAFDRSRLERFLREWAAGQRSVAVARRLALHEVAEAHELMEGGGVGGKILLIP